MQVITYNDIINVIKNLIRIQIFDKLKQLNIEKIDAIVIPKSSFNFANDLFYELGSCINNIELAPRIPDHGTYDRLFSKMTFEEDSILIIDSILDTGFTLGMVVESLKKKVKNVITCTLLKKIREDKICYYDNPEHIYGILISDYFVVGYGLDYNQQFRNIKHIFDYEDVKRYINENGLHSFYEYSKSLEE